MKLKTTKRKPKPIKPTHDMTINIVTIGRGMFPRIEFDPITHQRADRCNLVRQARAYHRPAATDQAQEAEA